MLVDQARAPEFMSRFYSSEANCVYILQLLALQPWSAWPLSVAGPNYDIDQTSKQYIAQLNFTICCQPVALGKASLQLQRAKLLRLDSGTGARRAAPLRFSSASPSSNSSAGPARAKE